MDLVEYGYVPQPGIDERNVARVVAAHKERYEIVCAHGEAYARLKSAVYYSGRHAVEFPTTGDFVDIQYTDNGDSLILATLERRSVFTRRDPGGGEQAEAANLDHVFILTSLNHDYNANRLERYLTLAWQSGATPVVVLTKADLVADPRPQLLQAESLAAGVDVFALSVRSGQGMERLTQYLQPRETVIFLGSSGVGKSSLINALAGEQVMRVNEIREDDSKGRHTTTLRRLIRLPGGAMVIDTPGMRQVGMWDVSTGIGEAFSDVEQYLGHCRFADCTHGNEPGCAIRAAIADGSLPAERWHDYLKLKREAKYSDDPDEYLRDKRAWAKSIAKRSKERKKNGKE
ncbi:MAG: ribosome small subunit-dependent GTPase A [Chloroflexi bacterium]|nr:ribosome small subunit-dependent GTPase A [Chloroflexota bacterium]